MEDEPGFLSLSEQQWDNLLALLDRPDAAVWLTSLAYGQ